MKYKVVYFTRTNNSKRVAEKIASKLSCEIIQITDSMNWGGVLGFIKGGYYASKGKNVDIKAEGNIASADELIVISPLWAGKVAPAIKSFLKTVAIDKVHLVLTSNGSTMKDPIGYKSVNDIVRNRKNEDEIINNFIKTLQ